ncbi:hypothetical protein NDR87_04580 [Nocardia sp. CDC159]|uniref:Uncharacterized protein n=1 Tax=Nocardia pulmonis TaxID=2951408 RepID=A0A9X2IUP2_9NOCA|nr:MULTISPECIES: hypothetical protein [Nocardia]MCM6773062.1 hypothetical protein [Nocardia pulmonis]MCM6785635.1 hypothetical protein [Nocardia sp. CDC159]
MTQAGLGLIDRYTDMRVRRWEALGRRTAGMLPGWRTRGRRRALVVAVAAAIAAFFVTGLLCAFDLRWAPYILLPAMVIFLPAWSMLRIACERHDSAPAQALDELEIAQRNAARSIGLAVTQSLTILPVFYLIMVGSFLPEADAFRTAYAGGAMALAALLAGGCAPGMILGWTRPDPDPEP